MLGGCLRRPGAPRWPMGAGYLIVKSPVSFAATGQPMVLGQMQRRQFITLLVGAAAWPPAALAQQRSMPVAGVLIGRSPGDYAPLLAAFHKGLSESGFVEGRNVAVEYRWADGHYDRLPTLANELVGHDIAVLAALGGAASALAAQAATEIIPVVFVSGGDPVELGLVASLNRPGGNVTGASTTTPVLVGKQFELLRELVPKLDSVGFLVNRTSPFAAPETRQAQTAARALGLRLHVLNASAEGDLEAAFATSVQQRVRALLVQNDAFLNTRADQFAALAARHGLPVVSGLREFAKAGGLMTYGPSVEDANRQGGIYVARILKGAKPAELPVVLPTKFELVINLKTAKALGLDVPDRLLALADEVIE
jgi:putative tryptophan/tyrosine transport system substrate-binding protein